MQLFTKRPPVKFPSSDNLFQWVHPADVLVAKLLLEARGKHGLVLEIGVHLGGWIVALASNTKSVSNFYGIDPYPMSGGADTRACMENNMLRYDVVDLYQHADSWKDMENLLGGGRLHLVHIDGEHSQSAVETDLTKATSRLDEAGVIVLDDYRHPYFPWIAAALYNFVSKSEFKPFLATNNKIYLSRESCHDFWYKTMCERLGDFGCIAEEYFGHHQDLARNFYQDTSVNNYKVLLFVNEKNENLLWPASIRRLLKLFARSLFKYFR